MLKIWGRRNSSNVQKVLWCCAEIGLNYEIEEIGGAFGRTKDADMLARNPNARVPTIDDDGFVLWESNAIVRYLAAKHDEGGLCPADRQARADAERWMDWQQTTVLAPLTTIFWGKVRTPEAYSEDDIAAAVAAGIPVWQILNDRLTDREWIMGASLTIADIPLGPMAWRWYQLADDRPAMPALDAWFERVQARPGFAEHVAAVPLT